jgi:hypothetical protein
MTFINGGRWLCLWLLPVLLLLRQLLLQFRHATMRRRARIHARRYKQLQSSGPTAPSSPTTTTAATTSNTTTTIATITTTRLPTILLLLLLLLFAAAAAAAAAAAPLNMLLASHCPFLPTFLPLLLLLLLLFAAAAAAAPLHTLLASHCLPLRLPFTRFAPPPTAST